MACKKQSFLLRIGLTICLVLAGVYFGNLAMFNVWQSAFSENYEIFDQLRLRAWTFGILAILAVTAAVAIVVATIRRMNAEYRQRLADQPKSPTSR